MQTVAAKTVISGLRWYPSNQYGLLITVGGVGGDFSQNCSSISYFESTLRTEIITVIIVVNDINNMT